jgi:8-amino-7-oxononanoate synthase
VSYLDRVRAALDAIRAQDRYRAIAPRARDDMMDFSSNDYLALARHRQVVQAFRLAQRVGSGGARLLGGAHREHSLLEEELAIWLGRERALLFSSGYHAAFGAIAVLGRVVERIYSDALNHASLIDGIRLAGTPRVIYPHRALPPRAQRDTPALIVTESIYGMDGDHADLPGMLADLGPEDVLLIDEAHALGVVGPQGAGLARALDDPRVVVMGTLSKAFGAHGGFIAGPAELIELLINAARTFIFDTALPPQLALAARVALVQVRGGDDLRGHLHDVVRHLRAGLRSLQLPAIDDPAPIVPVVLGSESAALNLAQRLEEKKIVAPAIRPPTVPPGTSRLRLSLRVDHQREHIDLFIEALASCIATS